MCVNNNYRAICNDFWDQLDAQVVCLQLNKTGCELLAQSVLMCLIDIDWASEVVNPRTAILALVVFT